ncbi:Na+-transporting NADH:ubiquinone oxidoreductase, subunit NqrB [Aphanothece hegewaldii CCALA 016]|uniref:Na+-transporting NADH:ubiquinone oxidoreductase, subunit NqrB n=1 Tax=Aphanothece hegewaldii CCALA 016 TaxID=2107694 RepID=A0A2T1LYE4_9CHRO|nr:RnfABCDGE type electron transport complex subunit D [Aphanothece hegewaldii]PSF37422.1 Na+-transporting NADH:ubiquinone oxidoreductase, subunit NqrB [Aphanothece hegewaldii CCALA 016]
MLFSFKDARDYQILFLSLFLCLGLMTRDWSIRIDCIVVAILSCLLTQFVLSFWTQYHQKQQENYLNPSWNRILKNFPYSSLKSALITALGLSLLLRVNDVATIAIAGCLAISSKFLFQWKNKHFFNPANFGIILTLLLTKDAWVSPGQWGTDWVYLLLFLGLGGIVLNKVGRWDTSLIFLFTYSSLELIRNYWLGWSFDVLQHHLMNGSLIVFALFMITDPRSIPNSRISRIVWSICLAILVYILEHKLYLKTSLFWSLFILSPFTLILDMTWKEVQFNWNYLGFSSKSIPRIT